MPGSVANAVAATVLPQILARAFTRSQEYAVVENNYRNGESQRRALTTTSRKRWQITRRLAPAAMVALRAFYDARGGPHEAFYIYDPLDPSSVYDATGVATTGRYTVHFTGEWSQEIGMGMGNVSFGLEELA